MLFVVENDHGQYQIEAQDFEIDENNTLTFLNTSQGIAYDIWEDQQWNQAVVAMPGGWVNLCDIDEQRKEASSNENN